MRKASLPSVFLCLSLMLLVPVFRAGSTTAKRKPASVPAILNTKSAEYLSTILYDSLQLQRYGLNREALLYACRGQQKMVAKGLLQNPSVITVCDFSQPSSNKRMYIIDLAHCKLLLNTYVAHGKNSGLSYAERFSNTMKSLKSSLGFYVTKNTYYGEHGLSLRLSGVERGYNDRAEARAVVIHGADYIGEKHSGSYMGRSFGCPAVPQQLSAKVIDLVKNGTCLFIYHPSKSYLHGSRLLNG